MSARRPIPVLALLAGLAAVAAADTPVRVIGADLTLTRATLLEADETGVLLRSEEPTARPTRALFQSVAAITVIGRTLDALPPLPSATEQARLFVELTDGQRLAVEIASANEPDTLSGHALGLGPLRLPLENVTRITRPGALWHSPTPAADTVYLTNGDRLSGFIESFGTIIILETDTGPVRVALDRVREVRLANPRRPNASMLITDDLGVSLSARSASIDASGLLRVWTDPSALGVDSRGEDTIAYDRPGARLLALRTPGAASVVALADAPAPGTRPTGDRRWTPETQARPAADPVLPIGDILMPAPAEITYPLPTGAVRFAATVRAARPGPWTDCIAKVHAVMADGTRVPVGERRLTRGAPQADIAAELPAGARSIVLEVDPGAYGAVQDAVLFVAPRLLTRD